MSIGRVASEALKVAGWTPVDTIPSDAIDKLEEQSPTAILLFSAIAEIYELFHHSESDRWMMVTDGGESFKVGAPGLLISSANPARLDADSDETKASTMVFTIGLDDKTVDEWLMWVGAHDNHPHRRPDMGYHYTS